MVNVFTIFLFFSLKTPLRLSLIASTISFGLSYLAFLFAAVIISILEYFMLPFINGFLLDFISVLGICFIEFLLTTIPFRFRRFQKGMPFLVEYGAQDIGIYISILLLFAFSLLGTASTSNLVYLIPAMLSLACGITLLFWWRNSITSKYMEKIREKEVKDLRDTILEKEKELEHLRYHNDELARIIHKDNKLIPAMEYAVREYLQSCELEAVNEVQKAKASELLVQLKDMTAERTGIVTTYEQKNKALPATDIPSIDTLMSYMLQKATSFQIDFDLSVVGDVKYLFRKIIDESDARTLLADLIENAIIATKKSERKKIMVHIGLSDDCYSMSVFDSGASFDPDTLLQIGIKQTTTHLNDGGSGIGMLNTYELSKKYNASLVIDESAHPNNFTKNVSVCFDNLGQYRVTTHNTAFVPLLSKRQNLILNFDTTGVANTPTLSLP
jgi:signal transduction histidine kinase